MSRLTKLFDSVNHMSGFDYRNTFKGLTFGDYISVIPASLRVGEKPYQGGYFFRCFNPEHPDTEPSLLVKPGRSQTCIWKCFGATSCPQDVFTKMFNTWLIKAGKINIQKLPTKTLEGLLYQGVISKHDYISIRDRRRESSESRVATILDSSKFPKNILTKLEADGTPITPHLKKSAFVQFAKARGF